MLSIARVPPPGASFTLTPVQPSLDIVPLDRALTPSRVLGVHPTLFPLVSGRLLPNPTVIELLTVDV